MRFNQILILTLFFIVFFRCKHETPPEAVVTTQTGESDTLAYHYNQLGDDENHKGNYTLALDFYQKSMEMALTRDDSAQYYASVLDRAMVFEKLGDHKQAVELSGPVISAYIRHGDSSALGRAYATAAIFYLGDGQIDPARTMLENAVLIIKRHGTPIEMSAALNQIAFTYSDQKQWERALPYLDSAWHVTLRTGIPYNLPGLALNLGNCYRELKQWKSAKIYLEKALTSADSMGQLHVKARSFERLSQIEEATGNPTKALALFREAKVIRDTLLSRDKYRAIEEMKTRFETAEKEREIEHLKIAEQNAVRAKNTTLIIALLTGVILLTGLGFLYYYAQNRKRLLEQNTAHLKDLTQVLIEKNEIIRELTEQLHQKDAKIIEPVAEAGDYLPYSTPILTKTDWVLFVAYFDRIYPGMLKRLRDRYPQISESEERVFLFLKLNMTRNEMAFLAGVSTEAIKKIRYRLRKRLQLREEDDLEMIIRQF